MKNCTLDTLEKIIRLDINIFKYRNRHTPLSSQHHVPRMPLFLLCLFCFLIAISIISPATETSAIHRHLEAHFGLDQVQSIADVEGIYSFIKSFEEKNLELMPTSPNYWCEHRYFQYQWDDHYMVPRTVCSSPRFTALGLQSAPLWTNETSTSSSGVGLRDATAEDIQLRPTKQRERERERERVRERERELCAFILSCICFFFFFISFFLEGSLEVKLPTTWTDKKQRREESEKRQKRKRYITFKKLH